MTRRHVALAAMFGNCIMCAPPSSRTTTGIKIRRACMHASKPACASIHTSVYTQFHGNGTSTVFCVCVYRVLKTSVCVSFFSTYSSQCSWSSSLLARCLCFIVNRSHLLCFSRFSDEASKSLANIAKPYLTLYCCKTHGLKALNGERSLTWSGYRT